MKILSKVTVSEIVLSYIPLLAIINFDTNIFIMTANKYQFQISVVGIDHVFMVDTKTFR